MANERAYDGPSWIDLRRDMVEVATAHDRSITVNMSINPAVKATGGLYFRVVATGKVQANGQRSEVAEGHPWPASDWRSVPAMLMALLWRLDHKLTELEDERARQSAF